MYTIGLCGLLSTDVGTVGRSGVFILCYIEHRVHTQFSVCTGNTTCIIMSVHTRWGQFATYTDWVLHIVNFLAIK